MKYAAFNYSMTEIQILILVSVSFEFRANDRESEMGQIKCSGVRAYT